MHRIVKVLFILCFFPSIVRSRKTVNLFTDIFLKIRTLQNNLRLHLDPRSLKTQREGLFIKRKKKNDPSFNSVGAVTTKWLSICSQQRIEEDTLIYWTTEALRLFQ